MSIHDLDSSDSDTDEALLRDIQALSAACGAPINSKNTETNNEESSSEDDDEELLSEIQQKYGSDGGRGGIERVLSLKPLNTLPPIGGDEDEDENDLELLLAIQRRFAQYCGGGGDNQGLQHIRKQREQNNGVMGNQVVLDLHSNGDRDHCGQEAEGHGNNLSGDQATCSYAFDQSEDHSSCELQLQKSSMPNAALAFIDAIKKNRSCQKLLRSKIGHVEARIDEVEKLNKRVKALKQFQIRCKNIRGRVLSNKENLRAQLISTSKNRPSSKDPNKKGSVMSEGPRENSHVANYRAALARFPQSLERGRWFPNEREELKKGIIQQYRQLLFLGSTNDQSLSAASQHGMDVDKMMSSIRDVEVTPEEMRMILPKVDWDQLASMYVPRHSGPECEARWLNFEDPLLNSANWTAQDDKNLLRTIEPRGIYNWIDIAESLRTNRTPFQCLARYQRSLNASIMKSSWTSEEDNLLRAAVEDYGESNWQVVASAIEGRTGPQCSNRWKKAIHPTIEKKGRWSKEEDKRLKIGMTILGPKWHIIAKFVPGRTQAQCRDRWVNNLDPSVNMGEWTSDEELKLRLAIEKHGYRWARVASSLGSRTDAQCRWKWKELFPQEALQLQVARDIQKTAFIPNFVDRESSRPCLGPKDFLALPSPDSVLGDQNVKASRKQKKRRETRQSETNSTESVFCNISKKVRSKRRRREGFGILEIPLISRCTVASSEGGSSLSNKKRRVRRCRINKMKHDDSGTENEGPVFVNDEDDASISGNRSASPLQDKEACMDLDVSNAVGTMTKDHTQLSRKKRRAKNPCSKRLRRGETLTNGSLKVQVVTVEGFTSTKNTSREQPDETELAERLPQAETCIEDVVLRSTVAGNGAVLLRYSRRRKTSLPKPDETDAWEHSTLEELFGDDVMRIKMKKIHRGR
ncbi:hypothetical protein Droror1_Dr00012266 [Drosera rotundifolia]